MQPLDCDGSIWHFLTFLALCNHVWARQCATLGIPHLRGDLKCLTIGLSVVCREGHDRGFFAWPSCSCSANLKLELHSVFIPRQRTQTVQDQINLSELWMRIFFHIMVLCARPSADHGWGQSGRQPVRTPELFSSPRLVGSARIGPVGNLSLSRQSPYEFELVRPFQVFISSRMIVPCSMVVHGSPRSKSMGVRVWAGGVRGRSFRGRLDCVADSGIEHA